MVRNCDAQLRIEIRIPAHALPRLKIVGPVQLRMASVPPRRPPFGARLKRITAEVDVACADDVVGSGIETQTLPGFIGKQPPEAVERIFLWKYSRLFDVIIAQVRADVIRAKTH